MSTIGSFDLSVKEALAGSDVHAEDNLIRLLRLCSLDDRVGILPGVVNQLVPPDVRDSGESDAVAAARQQLRNDMNHALRSLKAKNRILDSELPEQLCPDWHCGHGVPDSTCVSAMLPRTSPIERRIEEYCRPKSFHFDRKPSAHDLDDLVQRAFGKILRLSHTVDLVDNYLLRWSSRTDGVDEASAETIASFTRVMSPCIPSSKPKLLRLISSEKGVSPGTPLPKPDEIERAIQQSGPLKGVKIELYRFPRQRDPLPHNRFVIAAPFQVVWMSGDSFNWSRRNVTIDVGLHGFTKPLQLLLQRLIVDGSVRPYHSFVTT